MKAAAFSTVSCLLASAIVLGHVVVAQRGGGQPQGAREVAVTEIPGVVAAGVTWTLAWQGTDNADGLVGTADGGLLFAQEQPNRVSKLDTERPPVGLPHGHSWRRFGGDRLQRADSRGGENVHGSRQTGRPLRPVPSRRR